MNRNRFNDDRPGALEAANSYFLELTERLAEFVRNNSDTNSLWIQLHNGQPLEVVVSEALPEQGSGLNPHYRRTVQFVANSEGGRVVLATLVLAKIDGTGEDHWFRLAWGHASFDFAGDLVEITYKVSRGTRESTCWRYPADEFTVQLMQ